MTKETLLYKLTGTETPRFTTERENFLIDTMLDIINATISEADVTELECNIYGEMKEMNEYRILVEPGSKEDLIIQKFSD